MFELNENIEMHISGIVDQSVIWSLVLAKLCGSVCDMVPSVSKALGISS